MQEISCYQKVDLFSMDVILFPIHLTNHWICGCIDICEKEIKVLDSFHGTHDDVLGVRRVWFSFKWYNGPDNIAKTLPLFVDIENVHGARAFGQKEQSASS